ncbi:B-cell receptor-associated 31-like protein [Teratosphaeria nubilosa]|uniref:Endoplasmic reticulum transmembrane protein n=1 Tax=Teratosphaeria nubilosa TaxID=161662 RepID=A0A6G1LBS1_9PEZI|nr:B-cell receptor-associated 31-like protein [Teratosphaeria nubilosa]
MTLYYSLVFALLVFEMSVFVSLIVPLPFTMKRKLFTFLAESPIVAKLQYGLKITFIFITILFIDSVNRVYRVQVELAQAKYQGGAAGAVAGSERMEVQARKFYSQRNMYLCGFTLFLSLILNRTYVLILENLRLEQEVKRTKGDSSASGKDAAKLHEAGDVGEIGRLKEELRKRDQDIEVLKKQSKGLSDEYNRLGDQFHISDGTPKKKV